MIGKGPLPNFNPPVSSEKVQLISALLKNVNVWNTKPMNQCVMIVDPDNEEDMARLTKYKVHAHDMAWQLMRLHWGAATY